MKLNKKVMIYGLVMVAVITSGSVAFALLDNSNEETNMPNTQGTNDEQSNTNETDKPIVLKFYENCCGDVDINPYNQSQLGIKEIEWLDETTVYVRAYVTTNCAAWIEGAGFRIDNNTIYLVYYIGMGNIYAACSCAYGLSFTLENLEPGEYNIELEPTLIDHQNSSLW